MITESTEFGPFKISMSIIFYKPHIILLLLQQGRAEFGTSFNLELPVITLFIQIVHS